MPGRIIFSHQAIRLPRLDRLIQTNRYRVARDKTESLSFTRILNEYRLEPLGPVMAYGGPSRNDGWSLVTNRGKMFIKQYKPQVNNRQIEYEHSILLHLASVGFPAPILVQTENNRTMVEQNGRTYAMFDFLEGYFHIHNYVFLPSQMRWFLSTAGYLLGWLHSTLEAFSPAGQNRDGFPDHTGRRYRDASWYVRQLEVCRNSTRQMARDRSHPTLMHLMDLSGWMEETLLGLDARLEAANLKRTIIHADYGPYNLLFKRGAPIVVVDFELARLDWRLVDLMKAIEMFTRNRFRFSVSKMTQFLDGYRQIFPITGEELSLLPDVWMYFIIRRLIHYWVRKDAEVSALKKAQAQLDVLPWVRGQQHILSNLGS